MLYLYILMWILKLIGETGTWTQQHVTVLNFKQTYGICYLFLNIIKYSIILSYITIVFYRVSFNTFLL